MHKHLVWVAVGALFVGWSCKSSSNGDEAGKARAPAPGPAPQAAPAEPADDLPKVDLPEDAAAPLPLDGRIKKGVLDNGLTYYVRRNQKPEKRAELWLVVDAGSLHEDDDQRGLAHFVEHMAFNGTTAFPKNELVSKLQSLGVEFGPHINASTSFDETIYKLRLPTDDPKNLELGLQILSEWASQVSFRPEDVDAERGVVLSEKRASEGAEQRVAEAAIEEVFQGGRYAQRLPIGLPKILKSASAETLKRYYKDWYHPANMAVLAVGDFDEDAMAAKIRERFSGLARLESPRAAPVRELPRHADMTYLSLADQELPISAMGFGRIRARPASRSMADYERDLRELLAASMLSKHLDEAKQKQGARFLMAAGAPVPLVRDMGAVAFFAMVNSEDPMGGFEDLVSEVERVRRHGFTASEYKRSADEILTMLRSTAREDLAGKEDSGELVEELSRHHLTGEAMAGRLTELAVVESLLARIEPAQLAQELAGVLDPKGMIVAVLGEAASKKVTQTDILAVLATLPTKKLAPYSDERSDAPLLAQKPQPGTLVSEKHHQDVDVHEWTLSNGARVLLKETDFKKDEIHLRASSRGGSSRLATKDLFPSVWASVLVALGGVGELDSVELEKAMAGRDVDVSPWISDFQEGISGSSGQQDLESMLQLVHLYFTAPRKDEKAFEIWRKNKLEEFTLAFKKPEVRFAAKLAPVEANSNPRVGIMNADFVRQLDLDASFDFYRDRFQDAGDFTFVIVGSFELEAIKPLVLQYIGSLADSPRQERHVIHDWPPHPRKMRVEARDGSSQRARLSFYYSTAVDPKQVSRKDRVAWSLVGDALQLRFLDIFREDMGATYSPNASCRWTEDRARMQLNAALQVEPKKARLVEKMVQDEIARVAREGIDAEHFAKVREAALKQDEVDLKSNSHWLSLMVGLDFHEEPLSEILSTKSILESLTADEVNAVIPRFLDPRKPVIGVHLPK